MSATSQRSGLSIPVLDEVRSAFRDESREHRAGLLAILAIAALLRLLYLGQPMRNDESIIFLDFTRQGWGDAIAAYTAANNHILHTLLAKVSITAFGEYPWALRLPALLAGLFAVPATYAVARVLHGSRAALLAASVVATSGMLVLYSSNALGISVVVLGFVLLLLLATRIAAADRPGDWVLFILIGTLGLWTTPMMLFPVGTVVLWLFFSLLVGGRAGVLRRVGIALVAIVALGALLYLPAVLDVGGAAVLRTQFGESSGWFGFFQTLPRALMSAVLGWSLGVPLLSVAIVVLALLGLRHHAAIARCRVPVLMAAFVWCAWLLLVTHRTPAARTWLWLYPAVAMLAAAEVVRVLERRERTRALVERRIGMLSAGFALLLAICVVTTSAIPLSNETGTFADARAAAQSLAPTLGPDDLVLAGIPTSGPLSYYLHKEGVQQRRVPPDSARRVFIVVDAARGQTLDALTAGSAVRDSARFATPLLVRTFTTSGVFLYRRKDGPGR